MVSRDDGANFIARGVRARRFFESAARGNDKLVRRKNQFRGNSAARFRNRVLQQTRASLAFQSQRRFRREDFDDLPFLGRGDQGRAIVLAKIDVEITRTPQIALVRITATLFGAVDDLMDVRGSDGEGRFAVVEFHPQRRQPAARRRDLISAFDGR